MVYIDYSRSTRLGNWMFQYAVAKSLSGGADVAFYVRPEFDKRHVETLLKAKDVLKGMSVVRELPEDCQVVTDKCQDSVPSRLGSDRNYLLRGVFQLPRFFDDSLVRELYALPSSVANSLPSLPSGRRVGVHVRRGDYLRLPHRHPFVGEKYLRDAVGLFPDDSLFVVCSDDIGWCRRFFTADRFPNHDFYFVEGGTALSDMYVGTLCNHNIMSNSTFSWWGAYLNNHPGKRVVMPSRWYGIEIGRKQSETAMRELSYNGVEIINVGVNPCQEAKALLLAAKTKAGNVLRYFGMR